jgi:hypothetical protein
MLVARHNNVVILCDPQKQVGVGATHGSPVLEILFVGASEATVGLDRALTPRPRYCVLLPACCALSCGFNPFPGKTIKPTPQGSEVSPNLCD